MKIRKSGDLPGKQEWFLPPATSNWSQADIMKHIPSESHGFPGRFFLLYEIMRPFTDIISEGRFFEVSRGS